MKAIFITALLAAAAIIRTDYGYRAGNDRIIRTDTGYTVARPDGSWVRYVKTDYGYAVTESPAGNTHPRRAVRK